MSANKSVHQALDRFDRTFASSDATALAQLFAVDARLLLLYGEPIEGRSAIEAHWSRLFEAWDAGAWQAEHEIVDVHGDRAYALSRYSETLVSRVGVPSRLVNGRLVLFLRRDADDEWRVTMAMNSHSRPVEELGPDGTTA